MKSHLNSTSELAAGAKAKAFGRQAFSHTQALWRFLANERVSPKALSQPLLAAAHEAVAAEAGPWVLCIHDCCCRQEPVEGLNQSFLKEALIKSPMGKAICATD
ncbi:hypothetical protein [Methylocaldum szegediense]|uniref:Transposase n=1 Tax=Methylocaldum szegediense TaxID=73780 RepID=A0ABM9I879_9GAMM|nr:hypothetical protein [Methylocaldum szegediense]CAI8952336.1 protein of unknown function [Methylocaldum szegediense]